MPCPPYVCESCGHPACPNHAMANPHPCNNAGQECPCEAYVYPPGIEASQYEGGGGSGGGGGSSGGW